MTQKQKQPLRAKDINRPYGLLISLLRAVPEIILRQGGGNGIFCPDGGCMITPSLS